ncbi:hypothetical protein N7527_002864 [Penicillium freii]|nr:hypothetical protein N7527_002864 [Penicillium freii]
MTKSTVPVLVYKALRTGKSHLLMISLSRYMISLFPTLTDPDEKSKKSADHNVVLLAHRHGKERQVQSSYATNAHCTTALDLVFKIHESIDIPPSSF